MGGQSLLLPFIRRVKDVYTAEVHVARAVLLIKEGAQEGKDGPVDPDIARQLQPQGLPRRNDRFRILHGRNLPQKTVRVIGKDTGDPQCIREPENPAQYMGRQPVGLIDQKTGTVSKIHPLEQLLHVLRVRTGQDPDLVEPPVDQYMPLVQGAAVHKNHAALSGQLHGQVQEEQGLPGPGIPDQGDQGNSRLPFPALLRGFCFGTFLFAAFCCHGFFRAGVARQDLQDLLPEIRLLIGQEISAVQKLFRRLHGRDQIVLGAEIPADLTGRVIPEGRAPQGLRQLFQAAGPQIPVVVEAVESIRLHHVGVGKDRPGNVGQVIPVLVQLLPDPLLLDCFALELYVQDTALIRRQLEQVKLLADVLDRVGKIKTVKINDPVRPAVPVLPVELREAVHQGAERVLFMLAVAFVPAAPGEHHLEL